MSEAPDFHHGLSGRVNHDCKCQVCVEAARDYQRNALAERAQRLQDDPSLAEHGRATTYHNWSCRCEPCRLAANAATLERKKRRQAGLTPPAGRPRSAPEHGSAYRYNRGCRCDECRAAVKAYQAARQAARAQQPHKTQADPE